MMPATQVRPAAIPIPIPTPAQIVTLVEAHERYADDLHRRMESDWDLLTLKEFNAGDGYRAYTSNEPMTYFNKLMSYLTAALIKPRIPVAKGTRGEREGESAKERFISGILQANDERLLRLGELPLQVSLATFIAARGWYCGRSLLVKDPDTGETHADITPWDPLHTSWGMGPRGLKWMCHKMSKTRSQIADEYPEFAYGAEGVGPIGYWDSSEVAYADGLDVYEWWDEWNNMVVVNGRFAKPPTLHGSVDGRRRPVVPAFFGAVGPLPLIRSQMKTGPVNLVHQGESIFAANRGIYDKVNLVLSTMLQLVALSRDQSRVLYSEDGTKTLEGNPSLEGSVVPLVFGKDKLELIQLLEMSKDTGAFLGIISGEVQRGALSYSVYGQLAFQLSGYAVNLLKQATEAPITPRQHAMETAYWQIGNLISDQFASGSFPAMQLQGYSANRSWFDEEFGPEMILGLPSLQFKMVVKTPQDDLQKMQLATLADTPGEGGNPMYPRRLIWDEILDQQDTDAIDTAIKEQRAENMLPSATLMTLRRAIVEQGRTDLIGIYEWELWKQTLTGGLPPNMSTPTQNGQNGAGSGKPGYSPETAPGPMQGAPMPTPTPQSGANVPPGSPRPGAQGPPVPPGV